MKKIDKKYIYWGLTALCVIAAAMAGNHALQKWSVYIVGISDVIVTSLRPIIIGVVFAYLLNPLLKIYEKYIFEKLYEKLIKNEQLRKKATRYSAIFLSVVSALAIVAGLLVLIIPALYDNIERLIGNMKDYVQNGREYLLGFSEDYPYIVKPLLDYYKEISQELLLWGSESFLPNANKVITSVSQGIYSTFKVIIDVVVGIIVCVYLLAAKERYAGFIKKLLYAFLKAENAQKVINLAKYTDDRVGGFLVGKIVDSAIIGVLSFIVFSIFGMPYTALISVVIGVTNIIPFFGPFIGAIPCTVLVLLTDPTNPMKAVVFVLLILAIQQLDGNIIGPKILGDRTGLDSFAVIFAILFAGGVFGIWGMVLGVPLLATLIGIITDISNKKLKEKNLPISVEAYEKPLAEEMNEDKNEEE